jgi:hypothetical protein
MRPCLQTKKAKTKNLSINPLFLPLISSYACINLNLFACLNLMVPNSWIVNKDTLPMNNCQLQVWTVFKIRKLKKKERDPIQKGPINQVPRTL